MNIKNTFQLAKKDRGYMFAAILSVVALLVIVVLCIIEIRPSELQVPLRNTVFGITYTYPEQWYNELSFVGFALLVWGAHMLISLKLYALKDRRYAIVLQYLTVAILTISFFILLSIFRVISIVE